MNYQQSSADDLEDLLADLDAFLAGAAGWVVDERLNGPGSMAYSNPAAGLFLSHRWDPGTKLHLSVHQATGYTGPPGTTEPGDHPQDSGNGYNATNSHANANLITERHVSDLGDGPFPAYHFFEGGDYLHVEVQTASGAWRRWGCGVLNPKRGDWGGGQYAYGCRISSATTNTATNTFDTALLDGLSIEADQQATLKVTGSDLDGEPAGVEWLVPFGSLGAAIGTDTAGNPRARGQGGFRSGPTALELGVFSGSALAGAVPLVAVECWHIHSTLPRFYKLGSMPAVAALNIRNFEPEQVLTIGADSWVVFPLSVRADASTPVAGRTFYSGIAHRIPV